MSMTIYGPDGEPDKPEPATLPAPITPATDTKKSSKPLVWPPSARDVTLERSGTIFAIVGAQHYRK